MTELKKYLSSWTSIFLNLIFAIDQNTLRDYIFSELLNSPVNKELQEKLRDLYIRPIQYPDAFLWYFQKLIPHPEFPFGDQEGRNRFFEAFLVLLSHVENDPSQKEMVKKMHGILSAGRYAVVRQIMQKASIADVQEFLLLATKCYSLSDHDIKILHSLAEVVHPSLVKSRKKKPSQADEESFHQIWTTQEGFQKLQQRIHQIATVETVENAKEIEVARAHGDLRENSEFKFALEKRDRLQAELKFLSEQLNRARVLTREDVHTNEVGVGVVVECKDPSDKKISYTLLGPWDADPEQNVLSFQSKLAQAMKGLSVGDQFQMQGEMLTITAICNFFDR